MNPLPLSTAWEKDFHGPVVGPVLAPDGTLYLADHLHQLHGFSPQGDPLWTRELPGQAIALAAGPAAAGVAVLVKLNHLLIFSAAGERQGQTEVIAEPVSLTAGIDGRAWLVASQTGFCQEYPADGGAGAAYHFRFALLAACYAGEDSLAAVSSAGQLLLLHRASGRFQVYPLNHYVGGLCSNREGTLLALPGYKEGVFLVRPGEKRLDTCELDRNVLAAALSPEGEYLLAGADDGVVALVAGGNQVVFSCKLEGAVAGLALGAGLGFAAAATAAGRVCLLTAPAGARDRYVFLNTAPADEAAILAPAWSLRLFESERRSESARRVWRPPGGKFIVTLDECQVLRVLGTDGRELLKRDFLGDGLRIAFNPSGRLVLAGDEFQLAVISLEDRALYPFPAPAAAFSASDQGRLALLGRNGAELELFQLGAAPTLVWKYHASPGFAEIGLAPSGEHWFGLFEDGWLRCLDLDCKLLWAKPVLAVPEIGGPPAPPVAPGSYRLKPWERNVLLISKPAVTAYGPAGEQLWCARGREEVDQVEVFSQGVLVRDRSNTYQLVGPDGAVLFQEQPPAGKTYGWVDRDGKFAFISAEGARLSCRAAQQTLWHYEAPALVEDVAASAEGVAVVAGEELLWLDLTRAVQKISRFDYLDL
jgi:hypothetical protein